MDEAGLALMGKKINSYSRLSNSGLGYKFSQLKPGACPTAIFVLGWLKGLAILVALNIDARITRTNPFGVLDRAKFILLFCCTNMEQFASQYY